MADVPVNWCPTLGTVLSNEEVHDGKYIETGDIVERRLIGQSIQNYSLCRTAVGRFWLNWVRTEDLEMQRN